MLDSLRRRVGHARNTLEQVTSNGRDWLTGDPGLCLSERTPFEVIHRFSLVALRYYPPLGDDNLAVAPDAHITPVVLVPPLAARPLVFDLLPQRSLVRYLRARGFAVYLIDWGEPDRAHAALCVRDYALRLLPGALTAVRAHSGEHELSLLAYCLGGLFALLHAGTANDGAIRNLVTVASPVDMHADTLVAGPLRALGGPARVVRCHAPRRMHRLDPGHTQIPGWLNALIFKATDPLASVTTYLDLLAHLHDRGYVAAHATTGHWLADMLDYPGALVQDFVGRLFIDNALADGRLRLGGTDIDLTRIDCPLLAIAGEADRLAGRASVQRLMDLVTSPDRRFALAPGGHAGVIAGSHAPAHSWRLIADWLAARSD